ADGVRMGCALRRNRWTRPSFVRAIRPACSRTRRCFEIAGRDMANGVARSLTEVSPCARRSSSARRVGWASAAKTLSSACDIYLTIWLNIKNTATQVKGKKRPVALFEARRATRCHDRAHQGMEKRREREP